MEIICIILPICFPNLCLGCSVFNYIPKCYHIFCSAVSEGGIECEAGPAARLISILKADDFPQRCSAAPDQHSCWSLHGQAAGAGFLSFHSWASHTSPQQPCQGHWQCIHTWSPGERRNIKFSPSKPCPGLLIPVMSPSCGSNYSILPTPSSSASWLQDTKVFSGSLDLAWLTALTDAFEHLGSKPPSL